MCEARGCVLIRSPPFSGKTSLQVLFIAWCAKNAPNLSLVHTSMLCFGLSGGIIASEWEEDWRLWAYEGHDHKLPRQRNFSQMVSRATLEAPILVIIDEVQLLYGLSGDTPFWKTVKRATGNSQSPIRFLLLAGANVSQEPGHSTPFAFPVENTLGFADMMLAEEEREHIFNGAQNTGNLMGAVMESRGTHLLITTEASFRPFTAGRVAHVDHECEWQTRWAPPFLREASPQFRTSRARESS